MSSDASAQARQMVKTISRLEALASLAEHPDAVKAGVLPYELGQGIRQALSGDCPELLTPDGCPLVATSGDPEKPCTSPRCVGYPRHTGSCSPVSEAADAK